MKKIGVVVGEGTGREIANIFKESLYKIAEISNNQVEVVECDHIFDSYESLKSQSLEKIEEKKEKDLEALQTFYKEFYSSGGRVIFRTAINAETLYQFRYIGKAMKLINFQVGKKTVLLMRDEMQGFYANNQYKLDTTKIKFSGSFSKENFQLILTSAIKEAEEILIRPFEIWVTYKHHLFANIIEKWINEINSRAHIYQPNMATELLFKHLHSGENKDILIITGNEVGDILHEVLTFHLEIGDRNTLYSKNIYLHPDFINLIEYQTVHGSADDIAGKDIVNPTATLRALGEIVEKILGIRDFYVLMNYAIDSVYKNKIAFSSNEALSTTEVVNHIMSQLSQNIK